VEGGSIVIVVTKTDASKGVMSQNILWHQYVLCRQGEVLVGSLGDACSGQPWLRATLGGSVKQGTSRRQCSERWGKRFFFSPVVYLQFHLTGWKENHPSQSADCEVLVPWSP